MPQVVHQIPVCPDCCRECAHVVGGVLPTTVTVTLPALQAFADTLPCNNATCLAYGGASFVLTRTSMNPFNCGYALSPAPFCTGGGYISLEPNGFGMWSIFINTFQMAWRKTGAYPTPFAEVFGSYPADGTGVGFDCRNFDLGPATVSF